MSSGRVYLDHAATSWPKPPGVLEACNAYQLQLGSAASRGAYRSSQAADAIVAKVRGQIAKWIGAPSPGDIAFTSNGTMALNAAILGFLHQPDLRDTHVVTTAIEHNSVLRPLTMLQQQRGLKWTEVDCDQTGRVDPSRVLGAIQPNTRLAIVNHGSNVTGSITDLASMSEITKKHGIVLLVDAAQTLGYVPIEVRELGIELVAAPLHKGAGGMLGTGFLYAHESVAAAMHAPWIGGTGSSSDSLSDSFPWRESIESGNLNLPGIASVGAGLTWLEQHHNDIPWNLWTQRVVDTVQQHASLRLVGPDASIARLPVISFVSDRMNSHEMAMALDGALGIEARSGFHCAASIHTHLGTKECGGTLRMSFGHTTTESDVDAACEGIRMLGSL